MNSIAIKPLTNHPARQGFSLIELMVAVAIVGILAAIAYPSYSRYVINSNRSAAQAHLMDILRLEQQYVLDNRAYTDTLANLNGLSTPDAVSKYYTITISVEAGPPPTFLATATPKAGTAQATDVTLTINEAGAKTPGDKW